MTTLRNLAAATLLTFLTLPLGGCPMFPSPVPYTPAPYPYFPPEAGEFDGPSLNDAHHDVEKWLASHYPGARLVAVDGPAVGRSGRAGARGWTFRYAVQSPEPPRPQPWPTPMPRPTASPEPDWVLRPGELYGPPATPYLLFDDEPQAVPVEKIPVSSTPAPDLGRPWPGEPTTRYLAITVDGEGRLLAPEDVVAPTDPGYGQGEPAQGAGREAPAASGDRLTILSVPQIIPAPQPQRLSQPRPALQPLPVPQPRPFPPALDFARIVSLRKLLATVEDLGTPIGPAGARVAIRTDAAHGAVVEIDLQVGSRPQLSGPVPGYRSYEPEPAVDPYLAQGANRKGAYTVECVAPPGQPRPYEKGTDGVLYRGSYKFGAYTGELLSRPARI